MIEVNQIFSNIKNSQLELTENDYDVLFLTRMELSKNRMRKTTRDGLDLGINLDHGSILHNGDLIKVNDKIIMIKQLPEKTISLRIKRKVSVQDLVLLGHSIGNMHKSIQLEDDMVFFPIINDVELNIFKKIFEINSCIETINIENRIFMPMDGANVHEHWDWRKIKFDAVIWFFFSNRNVCNV